MPRRRKPKARIRLTAAEMRGAAAKGGELLGEALDILTERMAPDSIAANRRARGRGSQLSALEQLMVMAAAALYFQKPKFIAKRFGMHKRTVQRVLATPVYEKFRTRVLDHAIDDWCGRQW